MGDDSPASTTPTPAAGGNAAAPAGAAAGAEVKQGGGDVKEAARTLAQRRTEIRSKLTAPKEAAKAPADAAASSSPPGGTSSTTAPSDSAASSASARNDDEDIAALIAEDRRLKSERKRIETETAQHKEFVADVDIVRKARAAAAKGDRKAAVELILGDVNDLFWDLAKGIGDATPGAAVDVDKIVEAKLAEREKASLAEREKAEREAQIAVATKTAEIDARVEPGFAAEVMHSIGLGAGAEEIGPVLDAYGNFVSAVADTFAKAPGTYPAVARIGTTPRQVVRMCESLRVKLQRQPSAAEVLQAVEDGFAAAIRETPYGGQAAAPARAAPTVTSDWRADVGRAANGDDHSLSLDQRRARIREQLRNQTKKTG